MKTSKARDLRVLWNSSFAENALGCQFMRRMRWPDSFMQKSVKMTALAYLGNTGDHRLQTLTNTGPASAAISSFGYTTNAVGQITNWTQNQGTSVEWMLHQDDADQLTGLDVTSQPSLRELYGYDAAGNRTRTQLGNGLRTGSFNALNQLTGIADGGSIKISGTTDEPSNVMVQGHNASMTNATNFTSWATVTTGTNSIPVIATDGSGNSRTNNYQVVVSNGGAARSFTYDADGNTLDDGLRQYQWDAENRLIKATLGSDVYEWAYNAAGERVLERKNGAITKRWVWTGGVELAQERDASNAVTKTFFEQGEKQGSSNYYYTMDHLGSIRDVTDGSGAVVANYAYDSWGNQALLSGTDIATFGYTGHYFQKDVSLILAKYRGYDPSIGRWISRDPIGEDGGLNLYGYVGNDPVNAVDLLGLEIFLRSHPVAFGLNHSQITIIPDDQGKWSNDPRFTNILPDGRHYATVGAGPENGNLVSNVNRPRDVDQSRNNYSIKLPCPGSENEFIEKIFSADTRYKDNLTYDLFPPNWIKQDDFNSNSYVNGLLQSLGVFPAAPPHTPGFNKPVPSHYFE